MKFIFKTFFSLYMKIPFLGKLWRNSIPNDFTFPVHVEGSRIKVLKNHWASIFLETYEPQTLQVFKNLLSEKKTFIDIGANVGLFSTIALTYGANVIAFEPHPKIRMILESNVSKRGAKVHPYALSNESSEVKLFLSDEAGSHSLSLETDVYVKVKTAPLDSIITSKVDLIKIDVEGAEVLVLNGMKDLIKAHKPDLIIEVEEEHLQRFGHTASSIFSFLESHGYTYQQIGKEKNYLFLVKEKNHLFQKIGVPSNKIWIEWIGLWGSGKTTCIKNLSKSLESSGYTVNSTRNFFSQNRLVKIYKVLKSFPYNLMQLLKLLFLISPSYLRAYFKKDIIVLHEFRSFMSCYLARLSLLNNSDSNFILWEGELHLIPVLNLNKHIMDKLIDNLLQVNRDRVNAFIFMRIDTEIAQARILRDQKEGKVIRFNKAHEKLYLSHMQIFDTNQKYLINRLKERGESVYERDGNDIEELQDIIRSL